MNEFQRHYRLAMLFSVLLTGVLLTVALRYASRTDFVKWIVSPEQPQAGETPKPRPSEQEISYITLSYIRSLAAYDQEGQPDIVLERKEDLGDGASLMHFRVNQQNGAMAAVLRVQDWHVLGHSLTMWSSDGLLSLSAPEPGQVTAVSIPVFVKGRAEEAGEVEILLKDASLGTDIYTETVAVIDHEFSTALDVSEVLAGSLLLEVRTGSSTLSMPLLLDVYAK